MKVGHQSRGLSIWGVRIAPGVCGSVIVLVCIVNIAQMHFVVSLGKLASSSLLIIVAVVAAVLTITILIITILLIIFIVITISILIVSIIIILIINVIIIIPIVHHYSKYNRLEPNAIVRFFIFP